MEEIYKSSYANLYAHHWWWRARERIFHKLLKPITSKASPNFFVLDVGCGDGWFLDSLPKNIRKLGAEIDPSLVSRSKILSGEILIGDLVVLEKYAGQVDLLCLFDVVEHIEDDLAFLKQARLLLKPTGKLIISVPALNSIWTNHDDLNHHKRRYSKKSLRRLISESNFSIDNVEYSFYTAAILKIFVRIYEKLFQPELNAPTAIPNKIINGFLSWLSYAEFSLVKRLPISFPFGSSLIAIVSLKKESNSPQA